MEDAFIVRGRPFHHDNVVQMGAWQSTHSSSFARTRVLGGIQIFACIGREDTWWKAKIQVIGTLNRRSELMWHIHPYMVEVPG